MSRTVRRTSGDRSWMKIEPEFEYRQAFVQRIVCINYDEYYKSKAKWWNCKPVKLVYGLRWVTTSVRVAVSPKRLDVKHKKQIERDWGNWNGANSSYKWAVKRSNRSKQRREIHKILKSCRDGFDDVYEYDDSYENATQRNLIWVYY